jgi:hypothetical protein
MPHAPFRDRLIGLAAATAQDPAGFPEGLSSIHAFWQLHFFIDERFETTLQQYGDQAHPNQFVIASAIAGHIEARHHGWMPRI